MKHIRPLACEHDLDVPEDISPYGELDAIIAHHRTAHGLSAEDALAAVLLALRYQSGSPPRA